MSHIHWVARQNKLEIPVDKRKRELIFFWSNFPVRFSTHREEKRTGNPSIKVQILTKAQATSCFIFFPSLRVAGVDRIKRCCG
jgi:hypothetical protein